MLDTIYDGERLWVVDCSPRMSSSGTKMLMHSCGNPAYAANVISALLYGDVDFYTKPQYAVYYEIPDIPKGKVSASYPDPAGLSGPNNTRVVEVMQANERVFEPRNDVQASDRGWVVSVGDSRENAQLMTEIYLDSITYDES